MTDPVPTTEMTTVEAFALIEAEALALNPDDYIQINTDTAKAAALGISVYSRIEEFRDEAAALSPASAAAIQRLVTVSLALQQAEANAVIADAPDKTLAALADGMPKERDKLRAIVEALIAAEKVPDVHGGLDPSVAYLGAMMTPRSRRVV